VLLHIHLNFAIALALALLLFVSGLETTRNIEVLFIDGVQGIHKQAQSQEFQGVT